jgi:hypothetical protein
MHFGVREDTRFMPFGGTVRRPYVDVPMRDEVDEPEVVR